MKLSSNGCGGKGSKFRPPYHLFFKASCDKHDEGYDKGGDALDRWYCDVRFYNAMRYDVKRRIYKWWLKKRYYLMWCRLYFFAVRLFWKKYFNYKNNKL